MVSGTSTEKPAIAFLTNGLYPCVTGGIEIFHHYFIRAVSAYYPGIVMTRCSNEFQEPGIAVFNVASPVGRAQSLFTIYYQLKHLLRYRRQIDVIYIPYSSTDVFQYYHVMLLAQRLGIPYVLRISDGRMKPARPDFLHAIYFKNAAGIVAVSDPMTEEYERRYGKPIRTIPSYLPFLTSKSTKQELRERHGLPGDALIILALGTVKQLKGSDVLFEALETLGTGYLREKNVVVAYVGRQNPEKMIDKLQRKVRESGMEDVVRFTGKVAYEQVHEFYTLADVFVIPSLFEARPLALTEALYHGLPAIGTDISTIANTIRNDENGMLVPPGEAGPLADALRTMIEQPGRRERYAQVSFAERDTFNQFDHMVGEYINLFEELMGQRRTLM